MTRKYKKRKGRFNPDKNSGAERVLRVSAENWGQWDAAAIAAGVSRNTFVVTVVNYAAEQMLRKSVPGEDNPKLVRRREPGRPTPLAATVGPGASAGDTVTVKTASGKEVVLVIIPSDSHHCAQQVAMDRRTFTDIPFDDKTPLTHVTRYWDKNPNFVASTTDSIPGWWILAVPRSGLADMPCIETFVIDLPSTPDTYL